MAKVSHSIVVKTAAERLMDVITDYENYPEFLPEISGVEVLSREEASARVRFEIQMIMRVSYTLKLTQESPLILRWQLEKSKLMKVNSGCWLLEPAAGESTRATYELELELAGKLPSSVNERMAGQALPETLARFKKRAETP